MSVEFDLKAFIISNFKTIFLKGENFRRPRYYGSWGLTLNSNKILTPKTYKCLAFTLASIFFGELKREGKALTNNMTQTQATLEIKYTIDH